SSVVPQRINSRGFETAFAINGNAATSPLVAPDTAGLERVEVLMGPASVLYGAMEPGAVINMVTKKPLRQHHFAAELEMGSYDWKRATTDLGGPLSDRIRGRLNVAYETKETFYDNWRRDRTYVAPVVEFGLSDATTLTLEAWYARFEDKNGAYDRRLPVQGMLLPNPNGQVAEHLSAAVPGLSNYYRQAYNYSANLVHKFSDNWSLSGTAIYDKSSRKGIIWGTSFVINPDLISARRSITRQDEEQPTYFANVGLRGQFDTGAVTHNVIMGVDYYDSEFEGLSANVRVADLSLFTPSTGTVSLPALNIHNKLLSKNKGVFLQERARIGAKLDLLVGLRWSEVESISARSTLPAALPPLTGVKQDKTSTQFGVIYDVTDALTVYASRVTSFVPRSGSTAGGTAFAPETGIQYEVGGKFVLGESGLTGNVAVYSIEKPNVLTPDNANPGFLVAIGEAKSRGAELSLSGRPMPGLIFQTAYGYLETEAEGGFDLRHSPKNTVTLFTRYDVQSGVLHGFGASGTLQYRDTIYPGAAGGLQFPSYTRLDLGLHYVANEHLEFGLNVKNATNEQIWDSDGPNWVAIGEGRTYVAGMKVALR
ncbi:TonB-dependent siderophore receptor, partial [Steroidobacter sp.]|uniref:TonB-dependent siderophore receptor n=1 Tax=Steroidobacter sp. TaxID=1978227 RepID=UPI001A3D37CF